MTHSNLICFFFFFSKIHNIGILSCTNNPIKFCTFCIVPDRRGCTRLCKYAQVWKPFSNYLHRNYHIYLMSSMHTFLSFFLSFSLSFSLSIYLKRLILFIFRILTNAIPKVAYKCSNFINASYKISNLVARSYTECLFK